MRRRPCLCIFHSNNLQLSPPCPLSIWSNHRRSRQRRKAGLLTLEIAQSIKCRQKILKIRDYLLSPFLALFFVCLSIFGQGHGHLLLVFPIQFLNNKFDLNLLGTKDRFIKSSLPRALPSSFSCFLVTLFLVLFMPDLPTIITISVRLKLSPSFPGISQFSAKDIQTIQSTLFFLPSLFGERLCRAIFRFPSFNHA